MDIIVLSSLAVAILTLLTCRILYKVQSNTTSQLPPGSKGWPIFGENLCYFSMGKKGVPEKFIQDRMEKYSSEIFQSSLFGESILVFCGTLGNKFIFSNENLVQSWWPRSVEKLFPFLHSSQTEVAKKTRTFLPSFLKPHSLRRFVGTMDAIAKQCLDSDWAQEDNIVTVAPLVKKYTFLVSCRVFLNVQGMDVFRNLYDQFNTISTGVLTLPINFPGTPFNRAVKASAVIRKELGEVIKKKKEEIKGKTASSRQDLLSELINTPDENGTFASEFNVTSILFLLLIASFDAPGTALTFVMKYLAEHPHVYNEVLKEQNQIAESKGPDELLDWENIQRMRYTWNVVSEVLRLVPPLPGTLREAVSDFTYAGFPIKKGWKMYWNAYSTHKNPDYFPDPEMFDPSRYEGNGPPPYAYVAFGGGARMCPGMEYARIEILVFIHNLVTRFRWEKLIPDEKVMYDPLARSEKGLPVRLLPHK